MGATWPSGGRATPSELADIVAYLLSPRASDAAGETVWIDGG